MLIHIQKYLTHKQEAESHLYFDKQEKTKIKMLINLSCIYVRFYDYDLFSVYHSIPQPFFLILFLQG